MRKRLSRNMLLPLLGLLIGCQPTALGPQASPNTKPKSRVTQPTSTPAAGGIVPGQGADLLPGDLSGIISRDGASIISRDGASIISRDGASLTGVARLPAGIISRDGASIISRDGASIISRDGASIISRDGASYRLAALGEEQPIRKQLVYLMNAAGQLVVGEDGEPITAETDEQGRFEFKGFVNQKHMFLAIKLYDDKGFATTFLPRGDAASRTADLTLASSLTATYIREQYLKAQSDQVAVLERLPAELESETRAAVGQAVATAEAPPTSLTAAAVLEAVGRLRTQDATVDGRFEEVRRVLLAGLSDQGAGQPADSVSIDAHRLAINPAGEIVFASTVNMRVWRKDAAGKLEVVAGSGLTGDEALPPSAPAPGDGGPATAAPIAPAAVDYAADGTLLIADDRHRRIRAVAPDGRISTLAASADWTDLRDVVAEPDGSVVVATHSALWRLPPGGTPVLIAGAVRQYDVRDLYTFQPTGGGVKPLEARFRGIVSIARHPQSGEIHLYDLGGSVWRLGATVERVAGTGVFGFSEAGRPATQEQIGVLGAIAFRADGTLLISDSANNRLRELTGGTIRTIAGNGLGTYSGDGGPAASAGLSTPGAVVRGRDGALYFTDSGYVRRLAEGKVQTLIGGTRDFGTLRPATEVQLLGPRGLTYDAAAHAMWVADDRHVWRWTLDDNRMVAVFGAGPAGEPFREGQATLKTALTAPRSVVPLGTGGWATLATDPGNQAGRVVAVESGTLNTLAGGGAPMQAGNAGTAVGAYVPGGDTGLVEIGGAFFYAFGTEGQLYRFERGGQTAAWGGFGSQTGSGAQAMEMNFYRVSSLAKGPDDQLYVGTPYYIYRIDPATGVVTHLAGSASGQLGDGLAATATRLGTVRGLAWDADGQLYFSELEGKVRRIRQDTGVIESVAGPGTPNLAGQTVDTGLGDPHAIAFDKNGDLYVADGRHGQIKVVRKAQLAP